MVNSIEFICNLYYLAVTIDEKLLNSFHTLNVNDKKDSVWKLMNTNWLCRHLINGELLKIK